MSQQYMTAKLNLTDGTIVYPQVSLDNIVNSINDPTLASVATGISISVSGGTATLVTNGGSGVAKFVGANGLVVSMNEGNEVVFTAPTVSVVGSATYADTAGSATHATSADTASALVSGYVATSATNATSAGTAAAITSGAIVGGYKTEIVSGNTVGQMKWFNIVNAAGATVTVEPGEAYKVNAANSAVTISATLGTSGQWGQEGHMEIFTAGTGNIHTGANVTLADGLEPDSVNNCTLRFHDGKCIISVEDHVAGYIVVSASGTSAGSLYYGLGMASEAYIAVDASLNGQTLDLGGVVTSAGEKHLVGNGYNETIVSGGIQCSSKTTFANLGMNNVVVSSGTLTLGDVKIPSGSTVAVSGGGLVVEKVSGDRGTIDLGGDNVVVSSGATAIASGCTFSGGSAVNGGAFNLTGSAVVNDCVISGNSANAGGGFWLLGNNAYLHTSESVISGNVATAHGNDIALYEFSSMSIDGGCTIGTVMCHSETEIIFNGSNTIALVYPRSTSQYGSAIVNHGATLDLTGNTNTTPIAPGGGITFEAGGATVKVGDSTASSSYMMDNVTLPVGAKLTNTAVVDLGGTHVLMHSGHAVIDGCVISGGYNSSANGNAFLLNGTPVFELKKAVVTNNSGVGRGAFALNQSAELYMSNTVMSGNSGVAGLEDLLINSGCTCTLQGGCTVGNAGIGGSLVISGSNVITNVMSGYTAGSITISSGASINLTSSIAPGGGIQVVGGTCTVNGKTVNETPAGSAYQSIVNSGGTLYIDGEVVP